MMADDTEPTSTSPDPNTTTTSSTTTSTPSEQQPQSSESILKSMRDEAATFTGPRTTNMGVTKDADGKSNIWALEPKSEVDNRPPVNKIAILGMVLVAVVFAVIFLPQLPFTNADQL